MAFVALVACPRAQDLTNKVQENAIDIRHRIKADGGE